MLDQVKSPKCVEDVVNKYAKNIWQLWWKMNYEEFFKTYM